ncbi:unnamed protein product [Pleuronectes platessa]|uniref:Uncharacterized protein n=1 Tax=Pleuronectes platessa TaxID=8262 RepID=A0A9N7TSP3_PLEPL|nr:unnamed protein product [Pleuronectes platessa]
MTSRQRTRDTVQRCVSTTGWRTRATLLKAAQGLRSDADAPPPPLRPLSLASMSFALLLLEAESELVALEPTETQIPASSTSGPGPAPPDLLGPINRSLSPPLSRNSPSDLAPRVRLPSFLPIKGSGTVSRSIPPAPGGGTMSYFILAPLSIMLCRDQDRTATACDTSDSFRGRVGRFAVTSRVPDWETVRGQPDGHNLEDKLEAGRALFDLMCKGVEALRVEKVPGSPAFHTSAANEVSESQGEVREPDPPAREAELPKYRKSHISHSGLNRHWSRTWASTNQGDVWSSPPPAWTNGRSGGGDGLEAGTGKQSGKHWDQQRALWGFAQQPWHGSHFLSATTGGLFAPTMLSLGGVQTEPGGDELAQVEVHVGSLAVLLVPEATENSVSS